LKDWYKNNSRTYQEKSIPWTDEWTEEWDLPF
jgi:hypothetical protein